MRINLAELDGRKALEIISSMTSAFMRSNRKFYEGDHWQDGAGWVGPMPAEGEQGRDIALNEIKRAFSSRNLVREGCERHANGVLGREFEFDLAPMLEPGQEAPTDEEMREDADRAELLEALTQWVMRRGLPSIMWQAAATALHADVGDGTGRAGLRLYVPIGLTTNGVVRTPRTIADALDYVHVHCPDPESFTVVEDDDTKREVGLYAYKLGEEQFVEVVMMDPKVPPVALDANNPPFTIVRTLSQSGGRDFPLRLGGAITMKEIRRPVLVTEQVRSLQKAFNLAESMLPNNLIKSGFLTRMLLNAQLPGEWVEGEGGGPPKFRVDEKAIPTFGPGMTAWISGAPIEDEETGELKGYATPQVAFQPPSPVTPVVEAKQTIKADILEEMDQAHVLIAGDATASGKSREVARQDFRTSLARTARPMVQLGLWVLRAAVAYAEHLMQQPGKYTNAYRFTFTVRIDSGLNSIQERQEDRAAMDQGVLSIDEVMNRAGVDDVEAMKLQVAAQDGVVLKELRSRADLLKVLTDAGLSVSVAAQLAGFDEEQLSLIQADEEEVRQQEEEAREAELERLRNAPVEEETEEEEEEAGEPAFA